MWSKQVGTHHLQLVQDAESLSPSFCSAEGLDEEAGSSSVQRGETSPHDVIDFRHLSVMTATHTKRQVPQKQLIRQRSCVHGHKGE